MDHVPGMDGRVIAVLEFDGVDEMHYAMVNAQLGSDPETRVAGMAGGSDHSPRRGKEDGA